MNSPEWKVGDRARVNQGKGRRGPTVWVIKELGTSYSCMVQEEGTEYAWQRFDTSLLVKEPEERR